MPFAIVKDINIFELLKKYEFILKREISMK